MLYITDAMVDDALSAEDVQDVLVSAFRSFARGGAAMQERVRSTAGGVRLSMLGALIPDQDVAGAKVYTTINGAFSFGILLFSTTSGALLATLEANAITRLRTAACSVIAARHLARPESRVLAIFGVGVVGREHATQVARAFPLKEILLCSQRSQPEIAADVEDEAGIPTRLVSTEEALANADIIVTASRSKTPLFSGRQDRRRMADPKPRGGGRTGPGRSRRGAGREDRRAGGTGGRHRNGAHERRGNYPIQVGGRRP
jgi:ornithine cyclodeaminase